MNGRVKRGVVMPDTIAIDELAPVPTCGKVLNDRINSIGAEASFNLDQEVGAMLTEGTIGSADHRHFMTFNIDLDETDWERFTCRQVIQRFGLHRSRFSRLALMGLK